jgi:hypothetical protein
MFAAKRVDRVTCESCCAAKSRLEKPEWRNQWNQNRRAAYRRKKRNPVWLAKYRAKQKERARRLREEKVVVALATVAAKLIERVGPPYLPPGST